MPVPTASVREVLQERQIRTTVDDAQKFRHNENNDGDGGGRRTLKRNKTFTANGRQAQPSPGPNVGRRHRRGTRGRYTVPLSAPSSPMVNNKYEPLYIETNRGIFEEAFGDGKRNSLNRNQINQLTAALALPERCLAKQISPTGQSTTSSSGFGSTDALASTWQTSSKEASPRSEKTVARSSQKVHRFHFWLLLCIQYVMHYFRRFQAEAKRRLETTPAASAVSVPDQELIKKSIPPALRDSRKRRPIGAKRKLQFEDEIEEPLRKPYYTEVHLGSQNQRITTLAAIEADRSEYPAKKLIDRAAETKFITTVFEVRHRGLEEIADSVREEMQRWYGEQDDNIVIVCCEMQWSTPDRYRNVNCETRMKEDVLGCLRSNNRRVLDAVTRRNERVRKLNQFLVFPDSVTEELAGRRPGMVGCWGGSYRRYYDGLLPWGHQEAAQEHQPWWELKKHALPESIDWPLIASPDKTTFIILNMVCLKLDQL